MFINTLIDKIRNKLILNAIRSDLNAETRILLNKQSDIEGRLNNIESKLNAIEVELNGLNELKSLEHSVTEYIKKADEKMMIHSDNLVLKIGENTSKFISAAMINRETFRPFKNYCKGKIFP